MKKYSIFFSLGLMMVLFTQCSLDDNKEYYRVLGTLNKTIDSTIIVSDDDERLLVNNPLSLASLNNNDRVYAYFSLTDETLPAGIDYVVDIYDFDKVLYKPIIDITSEIEDSIGNDPISVNGLNVVKDYLNLSFSYYGSGSVKHFINLVKQPGAIPVDVVNLEFRHNNKDDYPSYVLNGLVTFDLQSIQNNVADSVVIHLTAKGFQDEDFSKFVVYKY